MCNRAQDAEGDTTMYDSGGGGGGGTSSMMYLPAIGVSHEQEMSSGLSNSMTRHAPPSRHSVSTRPVSRLTTTDPHAQSMSKKLQQQQQTLPLKNGRIDYHALIEGGGLATPPPTRGASVSRQSQRTTSRATTSLEIHPHHEKVCRSPTIPSPSDFAAQDTDLSYLETWTPVVEMSVPDLVRKLGHLGLYKTAKYVEGAVTVWDYSTEKKSVSGVARDDVLKVAEEERRRTLLLESKINLERAQRGGDFC
eukprot:PhF_6_TR12522/c0_g1_i1/m.19645